MADGFEVKIEAESLDAFISRAANKLETLSETFVTETLADIALEVEGLVLAAILNEHPIGEFMYERTQIQVIPGENDILIKISGRPENELAPNIRKSTKAYNLWNVHEYGSSGGQDITAQPGHPIPIIKDIGAPPQSFRMSSTSHPQQKYQGMVQQIVNNLIPQLDAKFLPYVNVDAVAKIVEMLQEEGIKVRGGNELTVGGWMKRNQITIEELKQSGIVRLGSFLKTTKSGESFERVYAQDSLGRFTKISTRSNIRFTH